MTSNEAGSRPTSTINLHVLSPSLQAPNKLSFDELPITTTIAELKQKIQESLNTKPPPARQRLIYRGKALGLETASLLDIFGGDTISSSKDLSLHLVLPPVPIQPFPRAGSNPRPASLLRPASPGNSSSPAPIPPLASTEQPPPLNESPLSGLGTASPQFHVNSTAYDAGSIASNVQIPPQMQSVLSAHLAALGQQLAGSGVGYAIPNESSRHRPPPMMTTQFQQILAQQQQARAAAGQLGLGHPVFHGNTHTTHQREIRNAREQPHDPRDQLPNPRDQSQPLTSSPESRSEQGFNGRPASVPPSTSFQEYGTTQGRHWQMVINETTARAFPPGMPGAFNQGPAINPASGLPELPNGLGSTHISRPSFGPTNPLVAIHQHLSMLEAILDTGGAPSENDILQARLQLHRMMQMSPTNYGAIAGPLHTRLSNLAVRSAQARAQAYDSSSTPASPLPRPAAEVLAPSGASLVYLLSSPDGPQALLLSPQGSYGTIGYHSAFQSNQNLEHHNVPPNPLQQAVQAPNAVNQVNDLIRILVPLGGNLWLLIRLLGVVYMFTGGWRRTFFLGLAAIAAFIAQTGAFRPIQRALWAPFRRHMEGLLEGAWPNIEARPDQAAVAVNQPEPNAADMAERLVLQQRRRNESLLWNGIRRAERAVALFLASLVPGVGERHIAARDAAEVTRQAQQRVLEEQEEQELQLAVESGQAETEEVDASGNSDHHSQDHTTPTEART